MKFKKIVNKMVSILLLAALMLNSSFLSGIAYADTNQSSAALASNETETSSIMLKDNTNNRDAVNILNYLTVKAYEVEEYKNNYLELDNIFNLICNGINIEVLQDDETLEFVTKSILPTITKFELDNNLKSRIFERYNQEKAMNITKGILATSQAMTTTSIDTGNIVGSIVGGAAAVATGVSTTILADQESEQKKIDDEFKLIQNSVENINGLKTELLTYMIKLSRNNGIADKDILRAPDLKEFNEAKKSEINNNKIKKLERAKDKLKNYGPYWLELSKANFQMARKENSNDYYKKCIEAFEEYEKIGTRIYRHGTDMEKYKFIPTYLEAIEIVKPNEYIRIASKYARILNELNIMQENWEIMYYLVALYQKLHSKTFDINYLNMAYDIIEELTLDVVGKYKNNHKDSKPYDETIAVSIIKLKEIADKLNKSENDKSSLDDDIFGVNGLFDNIYIDHALLFSEARKASKKREIENTDNNYVFVGTDGVKGGKFEISFGVRIFIDGVSYAEIEYSYPRYGLGVGGEDKGSGKGYIYEKYYTMPVKGMDRDGAKVKITFEPMKRIRNIQSLELLNIPEYKFEMVFKREGGPNDINAYYELVNSRDLTNY